MRKLFGMSNRKTEDVDSRSQDEERIRDILDGLIKSLVSYPEDIAIRLTRGERTTVFNVDCSQRVVGQLIGAKGKTIQSLRVLAMGMSCLRGFRSVIEIPYFDRDPAP